MLIKQQRDISNWIWISWEEMLTLNGTASEFNQILYLPTMRFQKITITDVTGLVWLVRTCKIQETNRVIQKLKLSVEVMSKVSKWKFIKGDHLILGVRGFYLEYAGPKPGQEVTTVRTSGFAGVSTKSSFFTKYFTILDFFPYVPQHN